MRDSQAERALLLEMDYTTYEMSCRDPYLTFNNQLVECRRQRKHEGTHATRHGLNAIIWDQDVSPEKKG